MQRKKLEFDTYAEKKAFIRGMGYAKDENVDVLSLSFYDMPDHTENGKHVIGITYEQRGVI